MPLEKSVAIAIHPPLVEPMWTVTEPLTRKSRRHLHTWTHEHLSERHIGREADFGA